MKSYNIALQELNELRVEQIKQMKNEKEIGFNSKDLMCASVIARKLMSNIAKKKQQAQQQILGGNLKFKRTTTNKTTALTKLESKV